MGEDLRRPGQYTLKWAFAQMTLCGVAFALFMSSKGPWEETLVQRLADTLAEGHVRIRFLAPALTNVLLFATLGAIIGGFFHRFILGAVLGAFLAMCIWAVAIESFYDRSY